MKLKEYITQATAKIFTAKEKEAVSLELTDHILKKQSFFEEIGYEEEIGEEKAVEEMGSGEEIADYLGSIHNDFYNPVFDLLGFAVWALFLAASYYFMNRYIFNDSTAVPISIGYVFVMVGIYFGFNFINIKRSRKLPTVLSFIIGLGIAVLSFFVNIHINMCGIENISQLKDLMFKGIIPQPKTSGLISPAIICAVIFVTAVAVLSVSIFFIKKYENQENTIKTNHSKKAFSKVLIALCIFMITVGAMFAGDIFIVQSKLKEQYIHDYNTVFEIAQSCESRQEVEQYLEEKGISPIEKNTNKIVFPVNTSNIVIDFSEESQNESEDPWARLMNKVIWAYVEKAYPESAEKKSDYKIIYDMSEKYNSSNGFSNGLDSVGLMKIKTAPNDLDNLFDFQTKKDSSNEDKITAFGKYYPKKITVYASNNHKKHSTTVDFDYTAGNYQNAFVQSFNETLLCDNAITVNEQKKAVLEALYENPEISNEALAEAVGAKYKKPTISFSDYKTLFNAFSLQYSSLFDEYGIEISDEELKAAYQKKYYFEFSDDLVFYKTDINGDSPGDESSEEDICLIVFDSRTNMNYISFEAIDKNEAPTDKKYVSRYGGIFRKTICENVGYYDIHGKAYKSEQDVAYYSKSGERFRYYQELDNDGKLIEQYFIGSRGHKCIANEGFVDGDGYFVCGDSSFRQVHEISDSSIDSYIDTKGNRYKKACDVSWDSNGNLLDFDSYLNIS